MAQESEPLFRWPRARRAVLTARGGWRVCGISGEFSRRAYGGRGCSCRKIVCGIPTALHADLGSRTRRQDAPSSNAMNIAIHGPKAPLLTIFTPTYNRAHTLYRVF